MSVRVCIPTAGTGSRLQELTKYLNKSLVSIANRPTLSHLIEQCPNDAEFVIALGHKGHLVRQFLELSYPERVFFFVEVTPFEGEGSGLGLSLMKCKDFLQQPFIFLSCDTLVRESLLAPDHNWLAYAERDDLAAYRTVQVENGFVRTLCEKGEGHYSTHKAYIGLAGIVDYELFWAAMESGGADAINCGEVFGLRNTLGKGMAAYNFTWFDTGNPQSLESARMAYRLDGAPNILPKANEAIWFVGQNVIKFSDDEAFIANRVKRAVEIKEFVPNLIGTRKNMYCYVSVVGDVVSDVVSVPLFESLLQHCAVFWRVAPLNADEQTHFRTQCMKFYKSKTLERIDLYYRNFQSEDGTEPINGVPMPLLSALLCDVDWEELADGLPGRFHGDFHFENILWSELEQRFTFLDWRQDFGGSLTVGDIYYDLAKLLHGLIVSHELIAKDLYHVDRQENSIRYDFHRKQMLVECEYHYAEWLRLHGYNQDKVQVLTALIFLNIAALHHAPYCHLLYALGKSMLFRSQNNKNKVGYTPGHY